MLLYAFSLIKFRLKLKSFIFNNLNSLFYYISLLFFVNCLNCWVCTHEYLHHWPISIQTNKNYQRTILLCVFVGIVKLLLYHHSVHLWKNVKNNEWMKTYAFSETWEMCAKIKYQTFYWEKILIRKDIFFKRILKLKLKM